MNDTGKLKLSLRELYPQLTNAQHTALVERKPMPPSYDWDPLPGNGINSQTITCVLHVTKRTPRRLAEKAVDNFLRQNYAYRELVIVNHAGPLCYDVLPNVLECLETDEMTATEAVTLGLKRTRGVFVAVWHAGLCHSPWYLSFMMAHREPEHAVRLLRAQVVDLVDGSGVTASAHTGISQTTVVPRALIMAPAPIRVLRNLTPETSCLCALLHAPENETPRSVLFGGHETIGWNIGEKETEILRAALDPYGFRPPASK